MARRFVNYFLKISSDEELDKLLQHKGLVVLDVYKESFGPCSISLHPALEKAKLTLNDSDILQLAVCDADKITKLHRFRESCQPTIVFCSKGKVVDVIYGANIPLLEEVIKFHLRYVFAGDDNEDRPFFELDELLPFEMEEMTRLLAEKEEAARIVQEQAEAAVRQMLDETIKLMQEHAKDMGVTFFMPHIQEIAQRKTADIARRMGLSNRSKKVVEVTPELLNRINYNLTNPMDDELVNYLMGKEVLAMLWAVDPVLVTEEALAEFSFAATQTQLIISTNEDNEIVEEHRTILEPLILYLDNGDKEAAVEQAVEEPRASSIHPQRRSTRRRTTRIGSEFRDNTTRSSMLSSYSDGRPKLVFPPVWTPANQPGNAILMFTLFRGQFEYFLPPVVEPEPPHLCMTFPASRRIEFLEIAKDFESDLLAYGFFTGGSLDDCKLICKTPETYNQLQPNDSEMIIVKVAKRTSHFALALTAIDPTHVSHDTKKGAEECQIVFNESFYEMEDEEIVQ